MKTSPRTWPASIVEAFLDGMTAAADMVIYARVDLPGRMDAELLWDGLRALARQEPLLQSRYRRGAWRGRWIQDEDPDWVLEERTVADEGGLQLAQAEVIARPWEALGTLPLEATLVHAPAGDRLLLRISHVLADGGGCKRLLYRWAAACRRLGTEPGWQPPAGRPGPRGMSRLAGALRPGGLPRIFEGCLRDSWAHLLPRRTFHPPVGGTTAGPSQRRLAVLRLGPARVASLQASFRPRGVTINDLLCAAYTRALAARFPPPPGTSRPLGLIVTSDLRKYLRPEEHICNISGLRPLVVGRPPLPPPAEHLQAVVSRTATWKRTWAGLGATLFGATPLMALPAGLLRRMSRALFASLRRSQAVRLGLTNMGLLEARRLDFGTGPCVDACLYAPAGLPPLLVGGATGCAGSVTFHLQHYADALSEDSVAALLQETDEELRRLERL